MTENNGISIKFSSKYAYDGLQPMTIDSGCGLGFTQLISPVLLLS